MSEHRPPDIVGPPSLPWAQWTVPTDGQGADSRVVLTQIDSRWRQRSRGAPILMIRAEKLPQSDVPALLEAIAASGCLHLRRAGRRVVMDPRAKPEPRWFWWPRKRLGQPWKLWLWGSDEWGRRDLGIRVPGGMVFIGLWRFDEFRGPCARCGQWEHEDVWDGEHCQHCAWELADYARGCTCPSILDDDWELDEWPAEGCEVHAHLERT